MGRIALLGRNGVSRCSRIGYYWCKSTLRSRLGLMGVHWGGCRRGRRGGQLAKAISVLASWFSLIKVLRHRSFGNESEGHWEFISYSDARGRISGLWRCLRASTASCLSLRVVGILVGWHFFRCSRAGCYQNKSALRSRLGLVCGH